jgi:hypothetical protein
MGGHLSDEDVVLQHYGEPGRPDAAEHLEQCEACRARLAALVRDLGALEADVPERGEDFGARVWARLEPRLDAPARVLPFRPRRLWLPASIAASMLIAFLVGRHFGQNAGPSPSPAAVVEARARERVLLGAVSDHLERSRRVLVEMARTPATAGPVDIAAEQASAANLVANSRLYRQSAERAGETRVADMLDELERVLVEIANAPAEMSAADLKELRQRIESRDLLFKVRALQSQVQERTVRRERPRPVA